MTAAQRRREIIDLLAGHLARMPEAIDVPASRPGSLPESEHEPDPKKLRPQSRIGLELSAS